MKGTTNSKQALSMAMLVLQRMILDFDLSNVYYRHLLKDCYHHFLEDHYYHLLEYSTTTS
jgi:hypothetical protein